MEPNSIEAFAIAIGDRWSSALASGSESGWRDLFNISHGARLIYPDEDLMLLADIAWLHYIEACYVRATTPSVNLHSR